MKLLPQRKTLVGYARKIVKAHSKVQIEILQAHYLERLTREEIEVLDYLCSYRLMQHETAHELTTLHREATELGSLMRFAQAGARAQRAVDAIIDEHQPRRGKG